MALAAGRKAARRQRTGRIRRAVAVVAVAAFLGPFGVIYGHVAAGKDPALVATTSGSTTTSASTSTSGSATTTTTTSAAKSASTSTATPASVTTQQS